MIINKGIGINRFLLIPICTGNWTPLTTESSSTSWASTSCVHGPNYVRPASVSDWSGAFWRPCRILSNDLKVGHMHRGWITGHQWLVWPLLLKLLMSLGGLPCTCKPGCCHLLLKTTLDAQILFYVPSCWLVRISAEWIRLLKDCICSS